MPSVMALASKSGVVDDVVVLVDDCAAFKAARATGGNELSISAHDAVLEEPRQCYCVESLRVGTAKNFAGT